MLKYCLSIVGQFSIRSERSYLIEDKFSENNKGETLELDKILISFFLYETG